MKSGDDIFATTRWSVVLAAGKADDPQADRALEELCHAYWYPLYAYVRRRGHSREDAEDLTQGFFARFLSKNHLGGVGAGRGRFRAFMLASLKHYLANEWDKSQRWKRGGKATVLPIDWRTADSQFRLADDCADGPDRAFDREWALALLARVIHALRSECVADDRAALFEELKVFLTVGHAEASLADAAAGLGMSPGSVRVAVHRLRRRYRELLRREVAETMTAGASVEEEMRTLFAAFRV